LNSAAKYIDGFAAGGGKSMGPILETRKLKKRFGDLTAVHDVSYQIGEDQTVGLIGPNGSGKTTFFNLLSGLIPPTDGTVFFRGEDITHLPAHRRVNLGIVRTFQLVSVFTGLSVRENMVLPIVRFRAPRTPLQFVFNSALDPATVTRCDDTLQTVGLLEKATHPVSSLSYGDKRMLEIAMALALEPRLLLLDEPLAGLSDHEIQQILGLIRRIENRFTIVIIEHKISKIAGQLQRLFVMNEGRLICEGSPERVLADDAVRECYWGREENC
jgi:branched-chain amino acid transport system ATP-binding protein